MTPQVALSYKAISEGKMIYEVNTKKNPLVLRSTTTKKYKKLGKYKKGTQVIVLDRATDSMFEVATPDGKHGYMPSESLKFIRNESRYADATDAVMEPRQLRDQPFRIYRIVPELDKVTAYARHIFYDLMDNMVKSFSPKDSTTGQIVIDRLSAACLSEHDFTFYSDLEATAKDVTFENLNPVPELITMTKYLFDNYRLSMYSYLNRCLRSGELSRIVGFSPLNRVFNKDSALCAPVCSAECWQVRLWPDVL